MFAFVLVDNKNMSFIDNLRALLAYAGGQDDETEESFYDRLDKQKQFYTPVRNAKPADYEKLKYCSIRG